MHITMRQLQVFESVSRHLSFTRASDELHLTQPAVSMQVKQLEASVGLPLFEQIGKKIHLTDAGRLMLEHSLSILSQLKEAEQQINDLKGIEGGHLKITIATTVNYFVSKLLPDFCRQHPKIRITLDVTNRKALLKQLEANETDIVLMGQPPPDIDVIAEPFMENPLVVIASPNHPLAARKKISLKTLTDETFIMRETGSGTRNAMERFFAEHGMVTSSSVEMTSNEAIKQSVQAGLGLAIISAHTAELEFAAKRLVQLKVQNFPIRRNWYITHRTGKFLSGAAQAFKSYIIQNAH